MYFASVKWRVPIENHFNTFASARRRARYERWERESAKESAGRFSPKKRVVYKKSAILTVERDDICVAHNSSDRASCSVIWFTAFQYRFKWQIRRRGCSSSYRRNENFFVGEFYGGEWKIWGWIDFIWHLLILFITLFVAADTRGVVTTPSPSKGPEYLQKYLKINIWNK